MKCHASLVVVTDCGPDTQRPGKVCCMETNGTVINATSVDGTNVNITYDQLYEHLIGKAEGWRSQDNGRVMRASDQMKTTAIESKIRASKLTDKEGKSRKNQMIETESNDANISQKKGTMQSKKVIEHSRAQAKKKKRRNNKRRRLQEQLDRITNYNENVQ